jgi:hypothetical protein
MHRSLKDHWPELTLVTFSALGFVLIAGAGIYFIVTALV